MARLPSPGGDNNTWGTILNDFLSVEHNSNGTLKLRNDGTLGTAASKDVAASGDASISQVVKGDDTRLSDMRTPTDGSVTDAKVATTLSQSKITNLTTDLAAKVDKSTVTTKGDLLAATGSSAVSRLGVGSNGQILTADSTQSTGIKWAAQNAGGLEIAYAEATSNLGPFTNAITSPVDMAGLQIAIPAGTSNYMVEFFAVVQVDSKTSWTSANGQPVAGIQLVDDGGIILGTGFLRAPVTAASQVVAAEIFIKRRMAATASAKTIKAQAGLVSGTTNMEIIVFAGTGTTTTNGNFAPVYLQAYTR